jgi:hypothetical protein
MVSSTNPKVDLGSKDTFLEDRVDFMCYSLPLWAFQKRTTLTLISTKLMSTTLSPFNSNVASQLASLLLK